MIAEESTAWPGVSRPVDHGGLGFGFKWNMGWMNDTLEYIERDPIHRQYHHNELTFSLVYAYSENFVLPLSHDEVVHGKGSLVGKMPGDEWRRFAGPARAARLHVGAPGQATAVHGVGVGPAVRVVGEQRPRLVGARVRRPLRRAAAGPRPELRCTGSSPALWSQDTVPEGFAWIDANDAAGNVLSFLRFGTPMPGPGISGPVLPTLACVANFSAMPHTEYRVGLPRPGRWREVLNTDAATYGGSGARQPGRRPRGPRDRGTASPASATIAVPPLGVVWLVPD